MGFRYRNIAFYLNKYAFLSRSILGPFMCELYGMFGSLFGCVSIWTMTFIALDRYNVIVKGLSAKPMTIKGALFRILLIYLFGSIWTLAPLFGWNRYEFNMQIMYNGCNNKLIVRYVPEGNMTACGTDYLNKEMLSKSYIIVYGCFVYFLPLFTIIYSYWFIVQVKPFGNYV